MAICSWRAMPRTSCRPPARVASTLAGSDVYYLYHPLVDHYTKGDDRGLRDQSQRALGRVWKGQRFSWWMTTLLHRFRMTPPSSGASRNPELAYLFSSQNAFASLAENYVGLPFYRQAN